MAKLTIRGEEIRRLRERLSQKGKTRTSDAVGLAVFGVHTMYWSDSPLEEGKEVEIEIDDFLAAYAVAELKEMRDANGVQGK